MPGDFFPRLEEQGLIRDQDKQWVKHQTFAANQIITGSLQAEQEVSSSNYVAGSAGWQIDGDGNAEFNNVTVRGTLSASTISGSLTMSGSGKINTAPDGTAGRMTITPTAASATSIIWYNASDVEQARIQASSAGQVQIQAGDDGVLIANGSISIDWESNRVSLTAARSDTTGSAANTVISGTTGRIQRSTSAKAYKSRITYNVSYLADIKLKPAKFYRKDDHRWRYGMIADDLADQDPLLGDYADDGTIENYDDRELMAVIAAKINRLEEKVFV